MTEPHALPVRPARPLRDLCCNLFAGLRALLLWRATPWLRTGAFAWIALELLALATGAGFDLLRVDGAGQFVPEALPAKLFHLPWLMLAVWVIARLSGRSEAWLRGVVAMAALWFWLSLLWNGFTLLPAEWWDALGDDATDLVWWAPAAWGVIASAVLLGDLFGASLKQRLAMPAVVGLCYLAPLVALGTQAPLWQAVEPEQAADEAERWAAARSEALIYRQPHLLTAALAQVEPGEPGRPELYLLALAGHGAQDVFLREVEKVEHLFAERFGTAGRSVVLANNPGTVLQRPLATVSALETSLRVLGERMNRDEDVLFVFLTSHGAEDHRFDLSLWPWELEQLTPQRLGQLLDAAGIRNRVILVSACFSGGFIEPLSGPDTLVMSAARADRSSHGCSHEADWTFFGRAYFDEALRQTTSFTEAFARARAAVASREKAEGLTPSEPQIAVGEAIKPRLDALAGRLKTAASAHEGCGPHC